MSTEARKLMADTVAISTNIVSNVSRENRIHCAVSRRPRGGAATPGPRVLSTSSITQLLIGADPGWASAAIDPNSLAPVAAEQSLDPGNAL